VAVRAGQRNPGKALAVPPGQAALVQRFWVISRPRPRQGVGPGTVATTEWGEGGGVNVNPLPSRGERMRQSDAPAPRSSPRPRLARLEDRTVLSTYLNPDQKFVQWLYNDFLQRSGVQNELNLWTAQLPGAGAGWVVSTLEHTAEASGRIVNDMYQLILNRP